MCNSTPKTGFGMALCINDSQNKFAQFRSEKLRWFISASSTNSPWDKKVKLALFPSHTSSSPSSAVIKIMRTKLCLGYAYVSSRVSGGVTPNRPPVVAELCCVASIAQRAAHGL